MKKYLRKQKNGISMHNSTAGITLIALVITIIVLLILAGIAVSMLSGENGILRKAAEAKEKTDDASILEQIKLAATGAMMKSDKYKVEENYLVEELNQYFGLQENGGYTLTGKETSGWVGTINGIKYKIESNGTVKEAPDITELIKRIKQEYEAKKNDLTSISTLSATPYINTGINESRVEVSDQELKKLITNYDPALIRLILLEGNLLCIYDEEVMNEEIITICEQNDIYLLGDMDGDHNITFWDAMYVKDYVARNIELTERQIIVADVNCSKVINSSDTTCLQGCKFLIDEVSPIRNMNSEFKASLKAKVAEGTLKTDVNATTIAEIQEYIPSYTGNEGLYKFKIQRGVLYWIYDKNLNLCPYLITRSSIDLLGDYYSDGILNEEDVEGFSTEFSDDSDANEVLDCDIDSSGYRILNLNGDDKIDKQDLELLKQLI